ncbi:hypothetical protein BT96DRAFT_912273 [Gymnopus androsaceus JB14]|uniref:Uncharacterized protein n=1 Tax=Gymnopus androsaceus JB14 TaxID=1447944 RepID=A0A6A4ISG0_9AGAR|nr:hypothetical protein BT96DRAFT_912273 [Gymnopus androsaceus JB14]
MAQYRVDIPTIQMIHQAPIPADILALINLNRPIFRGTPISRADLQHAEGTIKALEGMLQYENAQVTNDITHLAILRKQVILNEQAYAHYQPVQPGIQAVLDGINTSLNDMNGRLTRIELNQRVQSAEIFNYRTMARNRLDSRLPDRLDMLQKWIDGDGNALAMAVRNQTTHEIPIFNPLPQVGDMYCPFTGSFRNFTHSDILGLVSYYNFTFGIIAGDTLQARKDKLDRYFVNV